MGSDTHRYSLPLPNPNILIQVHGSTIRQAQSVHVPHGATGIYDDPIFTNQPHSNMLNLQPYTGGHSAVPSYQYHSQNLAPVNHQIVSGPTFGNNHSFSQQVMQSLYNPINDFHTLDNNTHISYNDHLVVAHEILPKPVADTLMNEQSYLQKFGDRYPNNFFYKKGFIMRKRELVRISMTHSSGLFAWWRNSNWRFSRN